MDTLKPDRFTYFPPSKIFGKTLVPIYYYEGVACVPISEIARALRIPEMTAFDIARKNREAIDIYDFKSCLPVSASDSLSQIQDRLSLGMDGICVIILNLDYNDIHDAIARMRIIVAKKWLSAQVANRLKSFGQTNQPRWDAGLSKDQSKELKNLFLKIDEPET